MAQRSTKPSRNPGGRPLKLTPDVKERLLKAIRAGNYYETACTYAGINYSTFRRWMVQGEKAKSGRFREFYEAVMRAEAEAEARVVAQWQQQIPEDWRAARDFLARRYPERWAQKDVLKAEVEHSGQVTERHEYEYSITQRIEHYADIYEKLAARGAAAGDDAGDDPREPLDTARPDA